MKTDTYLNAAKANLYFILSASLAIISTTIFVIIGEFTRQPLIIVVPLAALIVYAFLHILKLNYVMFSDEGGFFIFRYFNVHPFMRHKKAFQIPKDKLHHYEIISSYWGWRKELILYQIHKNEIIQYPSLGIGLFSDKQLKQIEESLNKSLKKIKK